MIDKNDNLIPDELEEMFDEKKEKYAEKIDTVFDKIKKNKVSIALGLILIVIISGAFFKKDEIKKAIEVEKIVEVEKPVYKDVPKYVTVAHQFGELLIINKDEFYTIKKGEVVQNGKKYYKTAIGSEKGDIKRYYTELKEIK